MLTIPDSAHNMYMDQPTAVAEAVREFAWGLSDYQIPPMAWVCSESLDKFSSSTMSRSDFSVSGDWSCLAAILLDCFTKSRVPATFANEYCNRWRAGMRCTLP